jgi:hypothetical protein
MKILVAPNISHQESHKESQDNNFLDFVLLNFSSRIVAPLGTPKKPY